MQQPLISVIMPVYNSERFLAKSLTSIMNQTYKNIEIIIVDDGSTDCSSELIDNFLLKDTRIRKFSQQNSGQASVRNFGVKEAEGSYILHVDSDDYFEPEMIQELVDCIERNDADVVLFQFYFVDENGHFTGINPPAFFKNQLLNSEETLKALFKNQLGPLGRNMLIKRDLFFEKEISFPVGRTREDGATIYKILGAAKKVFLLARQFYYYVQHDLSTVHQFKSENFYNVLLNNHELMEYVEKEYFSLINYAIDFSVLNLFSDYRQMVINGTSLTKEEKKDCREALADYISSIKKSNLSKKNRLKIALFKLRILPLIYQAKSKVG